MILNRKELYGKPGIYKIYTSVNNKIYIGSSNNLYKRLSQHFERLKKLTHTNIILLNHCKKYGLVFGPFVLGLHYNHWQWLLLYIPIVSLILAIKTYDF